MAPLVPSAKARASHVSVGLIACTFVAIELTGGEMSTASTTGAVDDIHALQRNIASSVEEQAAVPAEVTTQLSAATGAADQVLAGLRTLSAAR